MKIKELRKLVTALIITASVGILFGCQEERSEITAEKAENTMDDLFTALSNADTTLLKQVTTDDFTLFEHEEVWNRDSLLALMPATEGRIWEIKDAEVYAKEDVAHIHYFNQSRKPENRAWLESALLIRDENGDVRIKFMHSTKLYLN